MSPVPFASEIMAETDAARLFIAVLQNLAVKERDALSSGKASDWSDYRRRVGRIQMAEEAEAAIMEALRKRLDPDEEDED